MPQNNLDREAADELRRFKSNQDDGRWIDPRSFDDGFSKGYLTATRLKTENIEALNEKIKNMHTVIAVQEAIVTGKRLKSVQALLAEAVKVALKNTHDDQSKIDPEIISQLIVQSLMPS
jgi:hypothetical protein